MRRNIALVALVALVAGGLASALELKNGRVKLVVDDRSGRFAVYYLADVAKNRYVSLLYDQETRTTYPTVFVDQVAYKLGEAAEFRSIAVKKEGEGVVVEYRSSFCVVRETFSFVSSDGSSIADGLSIAFSIENVSGRDQSVGLRLLLDTWLGEKSGRHFESQAAGALATETALSGDYADAWILCPGDAEASAQIMLGGLATKPDRAVAANWKRINDAAWSFDVNTSRAFTLLPYSINDSAVALYYEPVTLRAGAARDVVVVIGNENKAGYGQRKAAAAPAVVVPMPPADSGPLDLMADIVATRSVLDAVNAALASGSTLSPEELAALEATLQRLEARASGY